MEKSKKVLQQLNAHERVSHMQIFGKSKHTPVCFEGERAGAFFLCILRHILLQDRNCLCADAWLP